MKRAYKYVLFVLLVPAWFGCKKDHDAADPTNNIIGYWELAETEGAMVPATTYPVGNGSLLVLKENTYAYYANGQVAKSGTYTTMEDNTLQQSVCLLIANDQFTRRIVYDSDNSAPKIFYQLTDNKLSFISGCAAVDATRKITYRRIKPNDAFELPE